jgi:hypothetical protein
MFSKDKASQRMQQWILDIPLIDQKAKHGQEFIYSLESFDDLEIFGQQSI